MMRLRSLGVLVGVLGITMLAACGSDETNDGGSGGTAGATGGSAGNAGQAGTGGDAGQGGATGGTGGGAGQGGTGGSAGQGGATGGSAGEAGAAGNAGSAGSGGATALCEPFAVDLHVADTWYFTLSDTESHVQEPSAWDFKLAKSGKGPWITLGAGVEAINLGNGDSFLDVIEAPDTGFDGDPDLIGDTWRSGGAGETGYTMSENIYVLKLDDGTYAKLTVTMAKAGKVAFDAFHQSDGSRNLVCSMP